MIKRLLESTIAFAAAALSSLHASAADDAGNDPLACVATLEAQCAPVIGYHAIFQQNNPVPAWGWSLPGAKITVTFDKKKKTTTAGKDSRWDLVLDPLPADTLDTQLQPPDGRILTIVTELDGKRVENPVGVRYAYAQRPLGHYLYNNAGLPSSPFTTSSHSTAHETKRSPVE